MARYRYLNCSELVAVRWLAGEALRRRRPRRAARARTYVTHPARDLASLALVVRQWISHTTSSETPAPAPMSPSLPIPLPRRTSGMAPSDRPRVPEPRTSPDLRPTPPAAVSNPDSNPATAPGSGFPAAVASRPRIRALREAIHSRTRPEHSPTRKNRAAARLRVRTATIRSTTRRTADRDGLWKDSLAAARILKWNLGRAA